MLICEATKQPENYGYAIHLGLENGEVRIVAGCRDFSLARAKEHWTKRSTARLFRCKPNCWECRKDNEAVRDRAQKMLKLLPKLKKRAAAL